MNFELLCPQANLAMKTLQERQLQRLHRRVDGLEVFQSLVIQIYSTYLKASNQKKKRKSESSAEMSPLTPDMNLSAPAPLPASLSNVAAPWFACFRTRLGFVFHPGKHMKSI